jgi:hypothetical protein
MGGYNDEEARRIILFIVTIILVIYFTTDLGEGEADVDVPLAQLLPELS